MYHINNRTLNPSTFVPTLFIGVGELGCFFTLRETYLHAVPGPGPMGNAVVNGVYQGSFEVRSYHVKNLSQDPDEAFEKAQEASERMGLKLTTSRDSLREEMNAIHRANAIQLLNEVPGEVRAALKACTLCGGEGHTAPNCPWAKEGGA